MSRKALPLSAAILVAAAAAPASALDFEAGPVDIQLNTLWTAGAAMRTESRDPRLIGLANGGKAYYTNADDGDLAFDRGDLVAGATKLTSDLSMSWGNFGLFARGTGVYNPVVDTKDTLFDVADYGVGKEQPLSEFQYKTDSVQHAIGRKAELLDGYLYGNIPLGDHTLSLRAGRQTVNWGESTFVLNGLNSLMALDANKVQVPGFDLSELVRSAGMAWASIDLFKGMSVEGFYQYEWRPTLVDAAGTFFSTNDVVGIGGTQANIGFGRVNENTPAGVTSLPGAPGLACLNVAPATVADDCVPLGSTVPRGPDRLPKDGGQYGGALRFPIPFLNDMQVGVYGMNYHSRLPVISGLSRSSPAILPNQLDTAQLFVEYPEDIHLYGVSFNTSIGEWAFQGEYSYKQGQPIQIDDVELVLAAVGAPSQISNVAGATLGGQYIQGYRRVDVSQVDFGLTRMLPRFAPLHYDELLLVGEVSGMHVNGMPAPWDLAFDAPATDTMNAGTAALNPAQAANLPVTPYGYYADANSWGYNITVRAQYNNLIGPITLEPTLHFVHDVAGTSPSPIANYVQDRKLAALTFGFKYLDAWSWDVGYGAFFGGGERNLLGDRDYVQGNLKYSF